MVTGTRKKIGKILPVDGEINSPVESLEPKFNIKQRYVNLNNRQKALVKSEYQERLNKTEPNFYDTLNREILSDEELHFFAGIFECTIAALYNEPLKRVPSIYELDRKAFAPRVGKQASINI